MDARRGDRLRRPLPPTLLYLFMVELERLAGVRAGGLLVLILGLWALAQAHWAAAPIAAGMVIAVCLAVLGIEAMIGA